MLGLTHSTPRRRKGFASCSGCGLCLLVCPLWRRSHDLGLTPLGRAKALQHGAGPADIADSVNTCTLCAACEPVCPEEIDLVAMTLDLRHQLLQPAAMESLLARMAAQTQRPLAPRTSSASVLLAGEALRAHPDILSRTAALLGAAENMPIADDDGQDIALALEAGAQIPAERLDRFLAPLRGIRTLIVADGLMLRHLRRWLPGSTCISLGAALSALPRVRGALRAGDLYVIEPRAYHSDYQRLVKYYDGLRAAAGCCFNLDLQRIAIPATARGLSQRLGPETADGADDESIQPRWILQGRNISRIVVESMEDRAAFGQVSECPVVHLAELADDGT